MQRHILGAIGLVMVAVAIVLFFVDVRDIPGATAARNTCTRLGPMLVVVWLAYPQVMAILSRLNPLLFYAFVLGLAAMVLRPQLIPLVLAAWAAIWFLQPRRTRGGGKKKGGTQKRSQPKD